MRDGLLLLLMLILAAGCDAVGPETFEPEYVVEAYLEVDAPLGTVRLGRTAPVGETYDFESLAVRHASVEVRLLDEAGQVEEVYPFAERREPGVYTRAGPGSERVLPGRRYALAVTTATGQTLTAETRTPGRIAFVSASADTVYYGTDDPLRVTLRRPARSGRQNVFVFTTDALDARPEQLVPFYRRLYDQGEVAIHDLRTSSSPLLNEANYDLGTDGTIEIQLPWIAVAFFGPSQVAVSTVDDNLYDFLRSQQAQSGGSTLAPGEIPNVLERVEGGTGVFGSYARTSYRFYIARADAASETAAARSAVVGYGLGNVGPELADRRGQGGEDLLRDGRVEAAAERREDGPGELLGVHGAGIVDRSDGGVPLFPRARGARLVRGVVAFVEDAPGEMRKLRRDVRGEADREAVP